MLSRIYILTGVLCASSYALAASPSIGTVTARGETKIDSYEVRGSGTVFDGSVVETGESVSSGADLRLGTNAEITLLSDSRGTLYRDRFVLQHGTVQLGSTNSFRVQANGVVVVPAESHSGGVVSIDPANSVSVEAKSGTLEIRNSLGATIARVRPGHPLAFSSATNSSPAEFLATGTIASENGHYYLNSADTGTKYEVKGDNLRSFDGASVVVSGVLETVASGSGVSGLLMANSIQPSSPTLFSAHPALNGRLIGGLTINSTSPPPPVKKCPPSPLVDCCPGIPSPKCCNPLPGNQCPRSH